MKNASIKKYTHIFATRSANAIKAAINRYLGAKGEEIACNFLQSQGWKIIDKNWRPQGAEKGLEIDIIALHNDLIVFVEVKTRSKSYITDIPAYTAFTSQKSGRVLRAARYWLTEHKSWDRPCRFDLICLYKVTTTEKMRIEYYEDVIKIGNSLDSSNTSWEPW